jgi:hypothetical protein
MNYIYLTRDFRIGRVPNLPYESIMRVLELSADEKIAP